VLALLPLAGGHLARLVRSDLDALAAERPLRDYVEVADAMRRNGRRKDDSVLSDFPSRACPPFSY
jgi:hypothetical protein